MEDGRNIVSGDERTDSDTVLLSSHAPPSMAWVRLPSCNHHGGLRCKCFEAPQACLQKGRATCTEILGKHGAERKGNWEGDGIHPENKTGSYQ